MRYIITPLISAAASLLSIGPAYADLGDQLFKLLPDDGAASDFFGISVAIDCATAIVGANFDDDNGFNSGSAYLFNTTVGSQTVKLLPMGGEAGDNFGVSVAISGTTAIVGAYLDDDNGSGSGSAYLFDLSCPTNPTQIAKLLADDGAADDNFGFSVAISGEIAIVGAWAHGDNGFRSGSAYLFNTTTGLQLAELLPIGGAANDNFGIAVAISGQTAIVGAPFQGDNGFHSGSAYLFDISDPTNPTQLFMLLPADGASGDGFGSSVAISGATAIAGASLDVDNGILSGSAYLFDTTTGLEISKLLPLDGASNDRFGHAVAISGTTAIVGAESHDDNGSRSGSAYLFCTTTGQQLFELLANDGATDDHFGISVAISGATAIVGAYRHDDNGNDSGSAYLFDAAAAPGKCPCNGCPSDLDGDGNVGASDLLKLLANWGPCP